MSKEPQTQTDNIGKILGETASDLGYALHLLGNLVGLDSQTGKPLKRKHRLPRKYYIEKGKEFVKKQADERNRILAEMKA